MSASIPAEGLRVVPELSQSKVTQENQLDKTRTEESISFKEVLSQFDADWKKSDASVSQAIGGMSKEVRKLFEVQRLVSKLTLQTDLLTKAGESVSQTLKKIQQMNG